MYVMDNSLWYFFSLPSQISIDAQRKASTEQLECLLVKKTQQTNSKKTLFLLLQKKSRQAFQLVKPPSFMSSKLIL